MADISRPVTSPLTPDASRSGVRAALSDRLSGLRFYPVLFSVYVGLALLIFTFMVPPFQKSDEPAHYYRSVSLTNLDFVCAEDATGEPSFVMRQKYAGLPAEMYVWHVAFQYNSKFDRDWLRVDFSDPRFQQNVPVYDICNLPPAGYLPNALGILAGKPFENPLVGFYLSRIAGALFFVGAIVLALRVVPDRYKLLIYLYAAIPMVLHQAGAVSYDTVHLALFPVLFAYATKFLTEEGRIRPLDLGIFLFALWWAVNVRSFAYYPFLLLFFLVPASRIASSRRQYWAIAGGYFAVAALSSAALAAVYLTESRIVPVDAPDVDASAQARYVIEHPMEFLRALYRTVQFHGEGLLRQSIGVFGWIDYAFNFVPYYAAIIVAGIAAFYIAERDTLLLRVHQVVALWAALFGTMGALALSLYAVWSPVGAGVIGGLQGRYFLGLLPFAIFGVSQTALLVGRGRFLQGVALILGLLIVASMFRAVEGRYYG